MLHCIQKKILHFSLLCEKFHCILSHWAFMLCCVLPSSHFLLTALHFHSQYKTFHLLCITLILLWVYSLTLHRRKLPSIAMHFNACAPQKKISNCCFGFYLPTAVRVSMLCIFLLSRCCSLHFSAAIFLLYAFMCILHKHKAKTLLISSLLHITFQRD